MNLNFLQFSMITVLTAFVFICFIMCLICLCKVGKLSRNIDKDNIYNEIKKYIEENLKKEQVVQNNNIKTQIPKSSICKTGIVHFNAFSDVTGAISFCVALLNAKNTGIIITSLYGRDTSNTYLREIKNGECNIQLLIEEKEALKKAIESEVI